MNKRILFSLAISFGLVGMISCGGNKSKLESPTGESSELGTVYEDTSVTPAPEADAEVPQDTPALAEDSAASDANSADNGQLNIKVTPGKIKKKYYETAEGWKATMTVTVTNLSNSPVSGKDYKISYKSKEWGGGSEDPKAYTTTRSTNGIDLAPNGSGHITISRQDADKFYDFKVKRK